MDGKEVANVVSLVGSGIITIISTILKFAL